MKDVPLIVLYKLVNEAVRNPTGLRIKATNPRWMSPGEPLTFEESQASLGAVVNKVLQRKYDVTALLALDDEETGRSIEE